MEASEENYERRNKYFKNNDSTRISVNREDVDQIDKYVKHPETLELLKKKGIKLLFPIQYKTFNSIKKGEDMIARDRTGSGKTLAFTLPVLENFKDLKYDLIKHE